MEQLVRPFIPVNSFTRQPAVVIEPPFEPSVGIRWGKPSSFVFSNQGNKPNNTSPQQQPPDDRDPLERNEIIEFNGKSTFYTIKKEEQASLGGISRMTDRIEFTGRGYVDRPPDQEGNPRAPYKQKLIYNFILKLNE